MGHRPGEVHLVVVLGDAHLVNEFQLRHDGAPLQPALAVQVRDVPDDEVNAVNGYRVALFEQAAEVVVMTGQLV